MALLGLLYLFIIFIVCFAVVHIFKLAMVGFKSLKPKPAPPKEEPKEKQPAKPEPVYYIVEKKRSKRTYGEPKEISFKK